MLFQKVFFFLALYHIFYIFVILFQFKQQMQNSQEFLYYDVLSFRFVIKFVNAGNIHYGNKSFLSFRFFFKLFKAQVHYQSGVHLLSSGDINLSLFKSWYLGVYWGHNGSHIKKTIFLNCRFKFVEIV